MTIEIESKRFTENVGVCWHAPTQNNKLQRHCQTCGIQACDNPTYTIELIRSELERVGKWDGFVYMLHDEADEFQIDMEDFGWSGTWTFSEISQLAAESLCDILTTPLLLLQAANGYIEV